MSSTLDMKQTQATNVEDPVENSGTVTDRLVSRVHVASRFCQANDGRATLLRQILTPWDRGSGSC